MPNRIVFMGSPDFALPTLRALHEHFNVVGVVTQPDRESGRGKRVTPPPVKILAVELGLPVIQAARLKEPEALIQLAAWAPDLIVVAAFGQILRQNILDLPAWGCLNVHASLLPRWRGASPIQQAILHGDERTGVTIMRMDAGLDTGPILSQVAIPVGENETAGALSEKLAGLGAALLVETTPGYFAGRHTLRLQDSAAATHAPLLKKEDGALDWSRPAALLARQVRAYNPWPGAFLETGQGRLKVHRAGTAPGRQPAGRMFSFNGLPAVGTGEGVLILEEVQPEGKASMPGKAFLAGSRFWGVE